MKQKGICVEIDQKKLGEDGGVEGRERKKKLEILEKNISCLGYWGERNEHTNRTEKERMKP